MKFTKAHKNTALLLTLVGAAAAIALVATSATAAPGGKGKRGKGDHARMDRGERMAKRLGLDSKQAETLKKLRSTKMTTTAPIKAQIRVKKAEMDALWLSPNVTKAALMAKVNEISALKTQMKSAKIDFKLSALKVLNAEQKVKFLQHSGKRGKHGKMGRRGHGKRGGKGDCGGRGGRSAGKRGGPGASTVTL